MFLLSRLLILMLLLATATAQQVVVVRSGSAAPYVAAGLGVAAALERAGQPVLQVELGELDDARLREVLRAEGPRAFVAVGTAAAEWLRPRLPEGTPLTYCMIADPEGAGLTGDRGAHGVAMAIPVDAQLELVHRALPRCRRIGVLYDSRVAASVAALRELRTRMPDEWSVEAVAVDKLESVSDAIDELLGREIDLLWTAPDSAVFKPESVRAVLVKSLRRGVPVFGFSTAFVRAGALLGVGIDPRQHGAQAGEMTLRLLREVTPREPRSEVPVFSVAINLTVSSRLVIELPTSVVEKAEYVFRED